MRGSFGSGKLLFYIPKKEAVMKKLSILVLMALMIMGSCSPRPQYKTRAGKKKNTHYNSIQYDKKTWNRNR